MTKKRRLFAYITVLVIAVLGIATLFVRWQLAQLSTALRTLPVAESQNIGLSALGDLVLDDSVFDASESYAANSGPILDQYRKNPTHVAKRATLTKTWLNASLLAKDISNRPIPAGRVVSSEDLAQVSSEHRHDGWERPFCVLSNGSKIVVLSGGDTERLNCDAVRSTAKSVLQRMTNAKLTKTTTGLLATVQPLSEHN